MQETLTPALTHDHSTVLATAFRMLASSETTTIPPPTIVSVPSDVRWVRHAKLLEKDDELKARARRLRVVEPPTDAG